MARASVFGASDGLVSNVSLILGVAGAAPTGGFVRLAGVAGLLAGAVSMGSWFLVLYFGRMLPFIGNAF